MDAFSIAHAVAAQEVVRLLALLATDVVTLGLFMVVCDWIHLDPVVHGTDVILPPILIFLRPESYRSHTPRIIC